MKKINLLLLIFSLLTIGLLSESCNKDESCPTITCNTGTINEETCTCACPIGYIGASCEQIDTTQTQTLLDNGVTPKALYDGGVTLDQLYGKMYEGGIIFYLNTTDGTGMVAATENQSESAEWGCLGVDITGLNNVTECVDDCVQPEPEDTFEGARIGDGTANTTAILTGCSDAGTAAKLCFDLDVNGKDDWFLPSRGELNLMYTNLHAKGHGGFAADWYWSSTEFDNVSAWSQVFLGGSQSVGLKDDIHVRAARAF